VSTNGSLLTKKIIDQVKKAGLSYLSVSIDSVGFNNGSKKTIQAKPDLMRLLTYARRENKIQVSFNTVLAKNNIIEVFKLFELSKAEDIPMSVGVVVMPPNNRDGRDRCLSFNKSDKELVESLARQILAYKNRGYRIIEPEEYFKGIWDYLNQSSRWDCKKTKSRTIQVHPSGKVYWCSKLNQLSKYNAYEMDKNNFAHFLKQLSHKIEECNKNCFSNCAFDSYFYQKNKLAFLEMIWRGFILNH
jgi:MoaA/NifB/PqqE/SkfB family radical SAM enzyme